jgi:hypothetical protein
MPTIRTKKIPVRKRAAAPRVSRLVTTAVPGFVPPSLISRTQVDVAGAGLDILRSIKSNHGITHQAAVAQGLTLLAVKLGRAK